jgi:hypothetical protein
MIKIPMRPINPYLKEIENSKEKAAKPSKSTAIIHPKIDDFYQNKPAHNHILAIQNEDEDTESEYCSVDANSADSY